MAEQKQPTTPPSLVDRDFETKLDYLREYSELYFPQLIYRRVKMTQPEMNDYHREVDPSEVEYYGEINLFAFVQHDPTQKELARYGIDEKRDVKLRIAMPVLIDSGLATQPDPPFGDITYLINPGDQFWFDGKLYKVLNWYRENYWGNTTYPLWITVFSEVRHPDVEDVQA